VKFDIKFNLISANEPEGDATKKERTRALLATMEEPLYKRTTDGKFVPVGHSELTPNPSSAILSLSKPEVLNANITRTEDWDGWPDGTFE